MYADSPLPPLTAVQFPPTGGAGGGEGGVGGGTGGEGGGGGPGGGGGGAGGVGGLGGGEGRGDGPSQALSCHGLLSARPNCQVAHQCCCSGMHCTSSQILYIAQLWTAAGGMKLDATKLT